MTAGTSWRERFSLPGSSTKLPASLRGYGSTRPNSTRRWQAFVFHSWPVTSKPWSPRAKPARSLFREIRARTALEAEADPVGKARSDWIVLNEVLGEPDATLAWFDRIAATRPDKLDMRELANRLLPLLLSRDRWADAARLVDDGVADVVRHHGYFNWDQFPPEIGEEFKNQLIEMSRESFRENAAQIRHMLIAANRTEEAAAVERKALELDPSEEMRTWLAKPRDQLRRAKLVGRSGEHIRPWQSQSIRRFVPAIDRLARQGIDCGLAPVGIQRGATSRASRASGIPPRRPEEASAALTRMNSQA